MLRVHQRVVAEREGFSQRLLIAFLARTCAQHLEHGLTGSAPVDRLGGEPDLEATSQRRLLGGQPAQRSLLERLDAGLCLRGAFAR